MAIEVYQRDWAPSLSLSHPPKNDGITLEVGKLNLGSPFGVKAIALSIANQPQSCPRGILVPSQSD